MEGHLGQNPLSASFSLPAHRGVAESHLVFWETESTRQSAPLCGQPLKGAQDPKASGNFFSKDSE